MNITNNDGSYRSCILILDFGSQYVRLISRIVKDLGIFCRILAWNVPEFEIREFSPSGIILSGSPETAINQYSPRIAEYVFGLNVPVLGICYGMQIMTVQLGGVVQKNNFQREFGSVDVNILCDSLLIHDIYDSVSNQGVRTLNVWMSHNDTVTVVPPGFEIIANTQNIPAAIISNEQKLLFGVQFHPEVSHTRQGKNILKRFVIDICKCNPVLECNSMIDSLVISIQQLVGNDRVLLGLSGGVDSSVTALLLSRALKDNLICLFIDTGLLTSDEDSKIIKMFCDHFYIKIVFLSEKERFFSALVGIFDPEKKRKIIGKLFIKIFEEQAYLLDNITWLAQGTICSDVIESLGFNHRQSFVIKSHHNVGGLPSNMKLKLVEPIKNLFKDEVRKIGLCMGLPDYILCRCPCPGPGLAIRIIGEVKREYCDILRQADSIFIEEIKKHHIDLITTISQAFFVFLSIRSIGIMGDNREYGWVLALRAVNSTDFMTASPIWFSCDFFLKISNRIINEIHGISRVVYDITSKPPSTVEWE